MMLFGYYYRLVPDPPVTRRSPDHRAPDGRRSHADLTNPSSLGRRWRCLARVAVLKTYVLRVVHEPADFSAHSRNSVSLYSIVAARTADGVVPVRSVAPVQALGDIGQRGRRRHQPELRLVDRHPAKPSFRETRRPAASPIRRVELDNNGSSRNRWRRLAASAILLRVVEGIWECAGRPCARPPATATNASRISRSSAGSALRLW